MERNVRVSTLPIPDIPQTGETASSSRVVYCVKEEQQKVQAPINIDSFKYILIFFSPVSLLDHTHPP